MDETDISQAIKKFAQEIRKRHPGLEEIVIVGIQTRGVPLAERLSVELKNLGYKSILLGAVDITFYRDDLSRLYPVPEVKETDLKADIDGKTVILIDDVIYTGRTIRAAMDELLDYGRPDRIELAVVVDRGERELPICPDYVGKTITTERDKLVDVRVKPIDEEDGVYLVEKP